MSVVTLNPGAPWTWQEAQQVAEKCLLSRPAKVGSLRCCHQGFELPYYSHVCWHLVLGMLQVRSGDECFDLGKMVLIREVSLSFNFVSSNMSKPWPLPVPFHKRPGHKGKELEITSESPGDILDMNFHQVCHD